MPSESRNFSLDEPFELDGEWLASKSNWQPVGGSLRYDGFGELTLTVTGRQKVRGCCLTDGPPPYVITGCVAADAGFLSLSNTAVLRNCYNISRRNHGKLVTEKLRIGRMYLGSSTMAEDCRLATLRLQFSALDEWAGPGLGYYKLGDRTVDDVEGPFEVVFSPPAGDFRASTKNADACLKFVSWWSTTKTELQFRANSQIVIDLEPTLTYEEAIRLFVRPLQDLITLGTGLVSRLTAFGATAADGDGRKLVQIVDRDLAVDSAGSHWLPLGSSLFSVADFGRDFGVYVARWLEFYSAFHTVCDLTFSTIYLPHRFVEANFLALVQSVEGYHRRNENFRHERMAAADWKLIKKQLLVGAPKDSRDIIAGCLQFGNEVSLRDRIDDVVGSVSPMLPEQIAKSCRDSFGKKCADARNALVHQLEAMPATNRQELAQMNAVLLWVLALTFMREMGLPDDVISKCASTGPAAVERVSPKRGGMPNS